MVKVGIGALAIGIGVAATVATGGAAVPLFGQSGCGVQWWISVLGQKDNVMKKNNLFICSLVDILDCAEKEKNAILDGKESLWNLEQIQKVIVPEISELLSYANKGKIYFKYGKKQRLLESSYLITDSLNDLSHTALGECVLRLQNLYDTL